MDRPDPDATDGGRTTTPVAGPIERLQEMLDQLQSMIARMDDAQEFLIAATLSGAADHVEQRLAVLARKDGRI